MYKMYKHFDWQFYLSEYEDLRKAGIKTEDAALRHYVKFGKSEGRAPFRVVAPVLAPVGEVVVPEPVVVVPEQVAEVIEQVAEVIEPVAEVIESVPAPVIEEAVPEPVIEEAVEETEVEVVEETEVEVVPEIELNITETKGKKIRKARVNK